MFLFLILVYFCSSEEELPTPSALEEKVYILFAAQQVQILTSHVMFMLCHICIGPHPSVLSPAKAAGDRASGEMAKDGEELGEV